MNNKKKNILILVAVLCVIFLGSAAGYFVFSYYEKKNVVDGAVENPSQNQQNTIYYEDKEYVYNQNLTNILFMGVDNEEEVVLSETPGKGGQADVIMIISLDDQTKTARILQISRDSMTDVDIYRWNGDYYTTVQAQLALQYAYGTSGETSCWAVKKTVSELLYELPIDGYLSMSINGISIINDAIGGVEITIPEDYTYIDPAFVKGETIVLNGEQAERYVRYRDTNVTGSNNSRMVRQTQYISALLSAVKSKVGEQGDDYEALFSLVSPYVVTDLSGDQMNELAQYQVLMDQIEFVPGESVAGEEHDEFYVNEEELQKLILKLFYKQK